jgi:hypothetical protein
VCTRGSNRALLRGPSTSPLEAMTVRAAVVVSALVLLLVWVLVPPFPRPETLLNSSLPALTKQFGPAHDSTLPPISGSSVTSVAWDRPRLVATWTLQAAWMTRHAADAAAQPDSVLRCLRWAPQSLDVRIPCDVSYSARVGHGF